jgi:hypothetical protein
MEKLFKQPPETVDEDDYIEPSENIKKLIDQLSSGKR